MKTTTTGDDIFSKVEETLSNIGLQWKNLKCVTTVGGRNMYGTKTGLVGNICKAVQQVGAERPMILHCIIHQHALCGQSLQLSNVMNNAVTANFIRSHALAYRQLKTFSLEIEREYQDIPYHCEVRWLSRGKVLKRFLELRVEIEIFMNEINRPVAFHSDSLWIWKLSFLVYLTEHINFLNFKLQGENSHLTDLYAHGKGFREKLYLFEKQISSNCLIHFPSYAQYQSECATPFPTYFALEIMCDLKG
jgi:hypothetical protein